MIFLCLEGFLFLTFTAVMFGTQIHSICNDETVKTFTFCILYSLFWEDGIRCGFICMRRGSYLGESCKTPVVLHFYFWQLGRLVWFSGGYFLAEVLALFASLTFCNLVLNEKNAKLLSWGLTFPFQLAQIPAGCQGKCLHWKSLSRHFDSFYQRIKQSLGHWLPCP